MSITQKLIKQENHPFYNELQSYKEGLCTLHAIALACSQSQSVDELLQRTTQILNDRVYTDSLTIGLVDEKDQLVRFFTPNQTDLEYPYRPEILLGEGIAGEVIRNRRSIRIADIDVFVVAEVGVEY